MNTKKILSTLVAVLSLVTCLDVSASTNVKTVAAAKNKRPATPKVLRGKWYYSSGAHDTNFVTKKIDTLSPYYDRSTIKKVGKNKYRRVSYDKKDRGHSVYQLKNVIYAGKRYQVLVVDYYEIGKKGKSKFASTSIFLRQRVSKKKIVKIVKKCHLKERNLESFLEYFLDDDD